MSGDDEARARATLVEMQSRIAQGPHIALGVAEIATAEQIRSAFLELTKQYHPARFGRMSVEVQRMSNEVFLGIKAAHEAMLRAIGAALRPYGTGAGGMPTIAPESSSSMRQVRPAGTGQVTPNRVTNQIPTLPRSAAPARGTPAGPGNTPSRSTLSGPHKPTPHEIAI
ncbi:MAG TPA: hypothetical protein VLX92_07295, partial [Kofleriaceae bacterium]|nr:hypothetical protein [Kofleriaceae bacterium]